MFLQSLYSKYELPRRNYNGPRVLFFIGTKLWTPLPAALRGQRNPSISSEKRPWAETLQSWVCWVSREHECSLCGSKSRLRGDASLSLGSLAVSRKREFACALCHWGFAEKIWKGSQGQTDTVWFCPWNIIFAFQYAAWCPALRRCQCVHQTRGLIALSLYIRLTAVA